MYTIQNAASKKASQEHLLGRKMAGSESFGGKLMETFTTLSRSLEIFITPKFLSESRCSLFYVTFDSEGSLVLYLYTVVECEYELTHSSEEVLFSYYFFK